MSTLKPGGRRVLVAAAVAVAAVAMAATALAVSRPPSARPQVATLPADGHPAVTLKVISGTRLLSLHVANLGGTGGTLLRAAALHGAPVPRLRKAETAGPDRSGKK